ncbi:unnamed protein product [Caenorhabditis auriculariae]|uniref:Uncharacterized protein n=1 Tax=Caenorhabditis auriculariae TaxID=2777116 RepID=A0A8S1GMJ6_9PELO|nr:unnamed protein product [Caenorhabditis auriculariae]
MGMQVGINFGLKSSLDCSLDCKKVESAKKRALEDDITAHVVIRRKPEDGGKPVARRRPLGDRNTSFAILFTQRWAHAASSTVLGGNFRFSFHFLFAFVYLGDLCR